MEKLFGIPIEQLMIALLVSLGFGATVVALLVARNPVVFRLAVRNVPRRKSQTTLIVLGLMLATALFSASFATGDTLTHSIRVQAVESLGEVDVIVRNEGEEASGRIPYFDQSQLMMVRDALADVSVVDAIEPMAQESAPVISAATNLSEPQVTVLGMSAGHAARFGPLEGGNGALPSVSELGADQVYISRELAEDLSLSAGDQVQLFLGASPVTAEVAGDYDKGGVPAEEHSLVMPLDRLQALTGNEGRINLILISNDGGEVAGARHTDEALAALDPLLAGSGLEARPVKRDALEQADEQGSQNAAVFLLFGQFSVAAGVLLIFLIFVMLAAERKHELGVTRAIGGQRGHIIRMFTYEGALYSLLAAAVGSVLGLAVGWALVRVMAMAFGQVDLDLVYSFNWRSLVIAFALGMVVTFLVVIAASWRVSQLNIVRAVRDLPEPRVRRKGVLSMTLDILPLAIGALLTASGYQSSQLGLFMTGISLIVVSIALIVRRFGVPDRLAFTVAGISIVAWWLAPAEVTEAMLPGETESGIEMFFLSGIMLVLGGAWALMYNYSLLLNAAVLVFGRVPGLAPTLKTAVSYPMQNRFRTGVTLALFSLVVFTLVVMAFITAAISSIFTDTEKLSGGFDLRSTVGYSNPIQDMSSAIADAPGLDPADFEVIAGMTDVQAQVTQDGIEGQEPVDLLMQGADVRYTEITGYTFAMRREGLETDDEVWSALSQQPGTAIVPYWMVPSRVNYSAGAVFPFQMEGFYIEDETLPEDARLIARDPRTGKEMTLQVIGVAETVAMYVPPVLTSQETVTQLLGEAAPPRSHMYRLSPGADAEAVGKAMESAFMEHGLQATVIEEEVNDNATVQVLFMQIMQGFMALGLVVGIAALGVILARAVVERRHEIGMLRAVGFQKSMIQFSFLLEASFIALSGIMLGVGLGLGLMPQLIDGMREQFSGLEMEIPWLNLALIISIAYLASLLTTFLPARQAANVYPAEALRYE